MRAALPSLLVVWGVTLLTIAAIDWAGYGTFLELLVLSR
jgi:ABC-type uncharacterized transport system involved in gliding motility auxiliary subunit